MILKVNLTLALVSNFNLWREYMNFYKIFVIIFILALLFSCTTPRELENPFDEKSTNYINLNNFADIVVPPNDTSYTVLKPNILFGYNKKKVDGYKIYFAEDENFTTNLETWEVTSFQGSIAKTTFEKANRIEKYYYWKYQIKWNGFYYNDHSKTSKFKIRNFNLVYPSSSVGNIKKLYYYKPDFEWENIQNNDGYVLQISQDTKFLDATTKTIDVSADYTKTYNANPRLKYRSEFSLAPDKSYYWRCRLKTEPDKWGYKLGSADVSSDEFKTVVITPLVSGIYQDDTNKQFRVYINPFDGDENKLQNSPRFDLQVSSDFDSGKIDIQINNISYTDINNIIYNIDYDSYKSILKKDGTTFYYVRIRASEQVEGIWYYSDWSIAYYSFKVADDW